MMLVLLLSAALISMAVCEPMPCRKMNERCEVAGRPEARCCANGGTTCIQGRCQPQGMGGCLQPGSACSIMGRKCCFGSCTKDRRGHMVCA